jgi:hypothetical protein
LSFGRLADVSIVSQSPIRSLSVEEWTDSGGRADRLEAPRVQRIETAGDFEADLILTAPRGRSLGQLIVGGTLRDSRIRAASHIGKVMVGGMHDSSLFAGLMIGQQDLPTTGEAFERRRTIRSLIITGLEGPGADFADSLVSAWRVQRADLGRVLADNDGHVPRG